MIPNTELSVHPMLICIAFLSVLCCFQILPNLYNFLLHFFEQFWSSTTLFTGLSQVTGVLHRLPYKASYRLIPKDACCPLFKQTLPSVSNLPIWLVCPSHTCGASLQAPDSLSLSLSISLRMVGGVEVQLCTQIYKHNLQKIGSKLGIPIRDYCLR